MTERPILAAALALTALLGVAAEPALAGKVARPDLVIEDGALTGRDYAVPGEQNVLRFTDETANRGYRAAGRSTTGIAFAAPRGSGVPAPQGFTRKVRRIKGFVGDSSQATTRSPKLRFAGLPLGAYSVTICADVKDQVKERNERNNCLTPKGNHLFLAKRTWAGSLAGSAPSGSGDKRVEWSSSDGVLELAGYRGDGEFSYRFGGTVTWATTGTDAQGCAWSGSGSQTFTTANDEPGDLFLDLDPDGYNATLAGTTIEYPTTATCAGGGTRAGLGPDQVVFLDTTAAGPHPFPFGAQSFAGTSTGPGGTWTWDFR